MRCEVVPSELSRRIPFSSSKYSAFLGENVENTFGLISKNGLWLYLVHDTVIDIYCTESGKWCGGYCFEESLRNPSAKITAALEFTSSHISYPCLLLAVNQDDESLLCLFDVNSCKVVRTVIIPDRVTSVDVVSGDGGVCIDTHNLSRRLRFMFGIIAVGTLHGHVFFLDLCLDENFTSNENSPSTAVVVKKQDFSAEKREAAIAKKQHILLHLNVESSSGGSFEFKSRSSTLGHFCNADVYVTAVKYIPSLTTLAVGFNFGGIQLWELHHLSLQFTIANDHEQAIVNFAFQEPENDPRNFCYLWVFKGHSIVEEELPSTISVATLYSLTYFRRDFVESFGALYTELQTCSRRFELPLTSDISNSLHSATAGSRLMSCQIINQKDMHHNTLNAVSANESDSASENMSLCFLSWEVWPNSDHLPPSYHLAVFDLNQWYQAHMPAGFRCHFNEPSTYLGIFSLNEAATNLHNEEIFGLYAVPQSIKKFKSLLVSEEFFYPSSLSFQHMSFSENGLCKTTYFGFQRHLLYEMAELGPQVLLNPKEIYPSLIKSGLIPDSHSGVDHTPLTIQKEMVLQLALEYHLPFFFMKCLKEWGYTESIHEFCTSKALLSWAWKRVINIKNSIDRFTIPLFNCSGEDVDKSSLKYLYSFRRQLNLIDSIMAGYQKYVTPKTEQGIQELRCRREAISSINMYLQVLLWLRSVNVLPEVCEEEALAKNIVYHLNYINDSYFVRRARLQKLHSSLASTDVLLIDGMMKEIGVGNTWQEKNGTSLYPPPSVYAALGTYLMDGISVELKHSLMYYLLLDLRNMNARSSFPAELKKFPVIFGIPMSKIKLIEAFWYLDRKDTEQALKKLFHPTIKASDILPWQHQRIIKSFLFWKVPQKSLKYINHMEPPQTTVEDMKLHLSVLLACGAVTQAYEFQRKKQSQGYGNELLNHLFLGCQELRKMKDLMYLPLNSLESWALVKFLSESDDPRAQESLVIYHLLHCNFFEAAKVNEKLSRLLMNKMDSIYEANINERTIDREALVESLMAAISNTERCLVEEMKRLPSEALKKEEVCQPLSVSIKCSTIKQMSYSDILQSLLCKASPCAPNASGTPHQKLSKNSYFEDVPFLRPPVTPEYVSKPVSIRDGNTIVNKRSLLSTSPTEFSPAKRSRLLDTVPFMSSPLLKRTPKSLAGDIVSLLQTPPIHRRTFENKDQQSTPTIAPQSILKKKNEIKKQVLLDFHRAPTPPLCSEDESTEDEVMEVDKDLETKEAVNVESASKQIRFDLPVEDRDSNKSSHFKGKNQENTEKPVLEILSVDHSNIGIIPATKETDESISSLTRKPLRGLRKRISFHDQISSSVNIGSETEIISMDTGETETRNMYPNKSPVVNRNEEILISDREGETGIPLASFSSNSGTDKVASISFREQYYSSKSREKERDNENKSPVYQIDDESDQGDDDVKIVMEVSSQNYSFQSSRASPRLPLRSEFPVSDDQNKTFIDGFKCGFNGSNGTTSSTEGKTSLVHSTSPEDCFIVGQTHEDDLVELTSEDDLVEPAPKDNLVEQAPKDDLVEPTPKDDLVEPTPKDDQSENEIFYSPCSDHSNSTRAPFEFSNPVNLFHETSSSSKKKKKNQVAFMTKATPHKPSTVVSVLIFDSSSDSSNSGTTSSDVIDLSSNVLNNSTLQHETLQHDKGSAYEKSAIIESHFEEEAIPEQTVETENKVDLEPQATVKSITISKHAFSFAKSVSLEPTEKLESTSKEKNFKNNISDNIRQETTLESNVASKHNFTFAKKTPKAKEKFKCTEDEKDPKVSVAESCESVTILDPQDSLKVNAVPKYKFTFTKAALKAKEELKHIEDEKDSKMDVTETSKSGTVLEPQTTTEINIPSKHKFEFTQMVSKTSKESKIVSEENSKMDIMGDKPQIEKELSSGIKKDTRSSRKIFMFTGDPSSKKNSNKEKPKIEKESFTYQVNNTEFLLTDAAGTYEEFSGSLKKNTSDGQASDKADQKNLLSSPCEAANIGSQAQETPSMTSADKSRKNTASKKKNSSKKDKSTSLSKIKKSKGKLSQKIEFSFAEPTSPATPEILEVLAKSPEGPLPSFIFSPPLTRGRLRQRRLDETMGSSFNSVASEMSFVSRPPPMDSILEGIIEEKKMVPRKVPRVVTKKRPSVKKSRSHSLLNTPEKSLLMLPTLDESKSLASPSKRSSPSSPKNTSIRHSMVLRQTKPKQKPDSLF
ncbi:protein ELYS [Nephila pilipes]|uniref:Protein ELYS n=1 Tax=Nephila pilipes TaxID=299642 RepID=A0A8X6PVJ6_NEPPI|nr:protein ELYS [Nephila pilipes]